MRKPGPAVVGRDLLRRPVDYSRYRGQARPDKTLHQAAVEADRAEQLRERSAGTGAAPTALAESLHRLGDLLYDLGWDDLADLVRGEELACYRDLDAAGVGRFAEATYRALDERCRYLLSQDRDEEALGVVDEQLRVAESARSGWAAAPAAARRARSRRPAILGRLGRHQAAVESAAAVVQEIRAELAGAPASYQLCHALGDYAEQLDRAGSVGAAADVTAEAAAHWRRLPGATVQYARTVDRLGDRLLRSGRGPSARAVITEAMVVLRDGQASEDLSMVWHAFAVRLLSLGAPADALVAGEAAVTSYRDGLRSVQDSHQEVLADSDWDDDHRYSTAYLQQRRDRELRSSQQEVRQAEVDLRDALHTLGECLRQLGRHDEAVAAVGEAARIVP